MRMMHAFCIVFVALLTLMGCGEKGPDSLWDRAEKAAASQDLVQAVAHYKDFVAQYPQHNKAAAALKNWAALEQQTGDMEGAIALYERLLQEYPQSDLGDEAQFMIAFIYEEYLGDVDKARNAYQLVIDRYPNSELAASAKQLLPHVGRSPEEWVRFQDNFN